MKRFFSALFFLFLWTAGTVGAADTPPQRIISLTLGTDEILLSLVPSNRILAVTAFALDPGISNVPALAKTVPKTMQTPSAEVIVALRPDLILAASYTTPEVMRQLKRIGLPVLTLSDFSSIDDIKANIQKVGAAVGEPQKAEDLIVHMETRLRVLEKKIARTTHRPGLLSYDAAGWTAGRETLFDEIVTRAGGRNLAAEAGLRGHPKISLEKVVEINPEILILNQWTPNARATAKGRHQGLLSHPALQSVSAVRERRVFEIPGKLLTSVSHFIVDGVEEMAKKLHPALFAPPLASR